MYRSSSDVAHLYALANEITYHQSLPTDVVRNSPRFDVPALSISARSCLVSYERSYPALPDF
jgi:hypothetical protein